MGTAARDCGNRPRQFRPGSPGVGAAAATRGRVEAARQGSSRIRGRRSAQEALLIGYDVCRALAAVHRAGFVHGDVKAQNVMRQVGGRIVLTDFGASRLIEIAAQRLYRTVVTPYYAAPEVLLGGAPTARSDFYSVGILLYYLVTGQFPISGRTIEDFRVAHASGRRSLLRDVRPDLPPAFIRVVDAANKGSPRRAPGKRRGA
ncbi:MAG: protein kinase domain-containing protein [Vicinamibacterales bacterium]